MKSPESVSYADSKGILSRKRKFRRATGKGFRWGRPLWVQSPDLAEVVPVAAPQACDIAVAHELLIGQWQLLR